MNGSKLFHIYFEVANHDLKKNDWISQIVISRDITTYNK